MDSFKAKDRERKAKERKAKKDREMKESSNRKEEITSYEKKKITQKKNNRRIQRKIRDERTDEEKEKRNAEQANQMRGQREELPIEKKMLALKKAKEGMRIHRKFGLLKKYKQRKIRAADDPFRYDDGDCVSRDGYSLCTPYLDRRRKLKYVKQKERAVEEQKRKETLKRMNRVRVQRHRLKIKKLMEEPVIIKECSEKGAYELLREANIREFERLKQESGLFD